MKPKPLRMRKKCQNTRPNRLMKTHSKKTISSMTRKRNNKRSKRVIEFNVEFCSDELFKFSNCKPCPVSKPLFLCGSDNKTYSSFCRLDYHNCLHDTQIKVSCKGFCPCQGNIPHCGDNNVDYFCAGGNC